MISLKSSIRRELLLILTLSKEFEFKATSFADAKYLKQTSLIKWFGWFYTEANLYFSFKVSWIMSRLLEEYFCNLFSAGIIIFSDCTSCSSLASILMSFWKSWSSSLKPFCDGPNFFDSIGFPFYFASRTIFFSWSSLKPLSLISSTTASSLADLLSSGSLPSFSMKFWE